MLPTASVWEKGTMMTGTQETPLIFAKIMEVMREIGAVGKTSDCKAGPSSFKYRGIDAVMNALQPALIKAGVCTIPEVISLDRQERINAKGTVLTFTTVRVKYRFYASDGSFIEAVVAGEGMDTGDKSVNKAMSAAYKYAAFQVLCIPTEEMKDPDSEVYADVMYHGYQNSQAQEAQPQGYEPEVQGYGYNMQTAAPVSPQPELLRPVYQPQSLQPFASINEAMNHICTFGRNAGKSMGQIASQPKSGEELGWFVSARPGSLEAVAASMILQGRVM